MGESNIYTEVRGSFRDPSGFCFTQGDSLYRQVNNEYKENYDHLISSGLYEVLADRGLLIPHEEVSVSSTQSAHAYKVIKPEYIPFISYPYEWCFSQLQDAALATLSIQRVAIEYGMTLKDASAYNIQFRDYKPVLIDTLSFEKRDDDKPWVAYKQFCQHFLAPLALMSYRDVRLQQLLKAYIDGVPVDLASTALPFYTRFKLSLLTHIHIHARMQKRYSDRKIEKNKYKMSRSALIGLIASLETSIKGLKLRTHTTEWADYYDNTNYSARGFECKKEIVANWLGAIRPKSVWDLGGNIGIFSRLASNQGIPTVCFDIDPLAVEKNYLECKEKDENHILPLLLDLTNPSPGIGWAHMERESLFERGPTDTALALALVHHLAISNNVPLAKIAEFFSGLTRYLIIEFVPKSDSQVKRLLVSREDIFKDYTQENFENEFEKYFAIQKSENYPDSDRILYLMESRDVSK